MFQYPEKLSLKHIKSWAYQGEGLNIEFKTKAKQADKIVKESVGFANTDGGVILIGVHDDGTIVGVKDRYEEEYLLSKAFAQYVRPPLNINIEYLELPNGRFVIVIHIPKSHNTLYYYKQEGVKKPQVFIRNGEHTFKASNEMFWILKKSLRGDQVLFTFGDNEKLLLELVDEKGKVTIQDFVERAHIPLKVASRILVNLVLGGVLSIDCQVNHDYYSLNKDEF